MLRAWKLSLPDADDDVVAVGLDHLHLGHVDDVQLAAELGQQARPLLGHGARAALQLREQPGEQRLALVGIRS